MKQRKELKKVIEKILGSSLDISVTSDTEEDKLKNEFIQVMDLYEMVWKRQTKLGENDG